MLELLVSGMPVDLSADSSISMEEESPVFDKDTIPGGFSFPFDLPATPRNKRVLGHPGRVMSAVQGGQELPFRLSNQGLLIATGSLSVQKATTKIYSAFLQVASGDFAGKILDKKLSDIDFGGERDWEFKASYSFPTDDFTIFPIYNPNFMDETQFQELWATNKYRLNSYENGAWFNLPLSSMAVTPFPFLAYVVERIFSQYGFPIIENVLLTDPDLKKLVIYNSHDSSNWHSVSTVVGTTTHPGYYQTDPFNGDYILDINGQRILRVYDKRELTMTHTFDTWNLKDFLPDMLIKDFILSVRNMFNLAIIIDNLGQVSILKRGDVVTAKTPPVTLVPLQDSVVTVQKPLLGFLMHWNHDKNDLLFAEEFKDIYEHPELLKPDVESIVDLDALTPTPNEIRLVIKRGQYFQYLPTTVDEVTTYSWKFYSNDFQDFKTGDGSEEYSTEASTLPMIHYQRESGGPYTRVPYAKQLSNSIIRDDSLPFSLRFLLYHGMIEDSLGGFYPYGSSDSYDSSGALLPNSHLSLKWQGPQGLYEQLWKNYFTWMQARKSVTFTIIDPSSLDFTTIYEIDGTNYLLSKRAYSMKDNRVLPGDCEFFTL